MSDQSPSDWGMALVAVLIAVALLSAVGLGLALISSIAAKVQSNTEDAVLLLDAAEAGLELTSRELAGAVDWDLILSGRAQSPLTGSVTSGVTPSGETIDVSVQTNLINCARPGGCTGPQLVALSDERPWGANNPIWQPYLVAALPAAADLGRRPRPFLLVWVADDESEEDGDPLHDAPTGSAGHAMVRVRAEALGRPGTRRGVEGLVQRVCWAENTMERCLPGVRVQSWREVRQWRLF